MTASEPMPVIVDACVFYSAQLRDIVMELGMEKVIIPRWTEKIQDEWIAAVIKNGKGVPVKFARTRELMNIILPESLIDIPTKGIYGLNLPDGDDVHVVEAALAAGVKTIMTFNLKHFPVAAIAPLNIQCIHPDDFLVTQMQRSPKSVLAAMKRLRSRLQRPPMSATELLESMANQQVPKFAKLLGFFHDSI